jgi:putative Mg2+ transporter-C (MgtC) family protein
MRGTLSELTISYGEVALRLLLAAVLCGIIGFEREVRDQPAGFRTHILVGLGAALFTLVSAYGFEPFTRAALEEGARGVRFDPTRISAQIVTGVGFLGAGAILRQGRDVRGLTTAASLWAVASIGLATGAGYLFGAVAATAVVLLTLFALRPFRRAIISRFRREVSEVSFDLNAPGNDPAGVLGILERRGMDVRSMQATLDETGARYEAQVRLPPGGDARGLLDEIYALPEVRRASATGLHGFPADEA